MNKQQPVGDKLAMLSALKDRLQSADALATLRQSLADRSNHVIERASELVGEVGEKDFIVDLVQAYRRLMINPLKRDPGCVGKTAIVRVLVKLEYDHALFYQEGITYQQPEPVWGGRKDTAAVLRGLCALGLSSCASSLDVLNCCAVLLVDPCVEARTGAAQAVAALGQPEGVPLLRLKLLTGDACPEVVGECCAALLSLARDDGMQTVLRLLSSGDPDVCVQAALALGASRHASAFEPLRDAWERSPDATVSESLLLCIGLLRSSKSSEFLLSLIAGGSGRDAVDAVKALKLHGGDDLRQRVKDAVQARGDARLASTLDQEWGAGQ